MVIKQTQFNLKLNVSLRSPLKWSGVWPSHDFKPNSILLNQNPAMWIIRNISYYVSACDGLRVSGIR